MEIRRRVGNPGVRLNARSPKLGADLKRLAILGSTGSIGQSTLSIVEQFPDRYSIGALAAGRNIEEAFAQARRWRPKIVSVATEELAVDLASRLHGAGAKGIEVVYGTAGTVACSTL